MQAVDIFSVLLLLSLPIVRVTVTVHANANVSIDDADAVVIYAPAENWRASSVECSACFNPISPSINMGTFHDGTGGLNDRNRKVESDGKDDEGGDNDNDEDDVDVDLLSHPTVSATVNFTGTAVYVYCIVPNSGDGNHITNSSLTFTLDGNPAGTYKRNPVDAKEGVTFIFNELVFQQEDLNPTDHQLVMTSPPNAAFLLDYILFTPPSESTTLTSIPTLSSLKSGDAAKKSKDVSFGLAVGASVGVLCLVTFTLCLSLYCRRRRSRRLQLREADRERMTQDTMSGPPPFVPRFFPVRSDEEEDALSNASEPNERTRMYRASTGSTASSASTVPSTFVPRYFPRTVDDDGPAVAQSPSPATPPSVSRSPVVSSVGASSLLGGSSSLPSRVSSSSAYSTPSTSPSASAAAPFVPRYFPGSRPRPRRVTPPPIVAPIAETPEAPVEPTTPPPPLTPTTPRASRPRPQTPGVMREADAQVPTISVVGLDTPIAGLEGLSEDERVALALMALPPPTESPPPFDPVRLPSYETALDGTSPVDARVQPADRAR